jgi:twitching motility protein PilT
LHALLHQINTGSSRHVITIEDPIEVFHRSQSGLVQQREVGLHVRSMANGIERALQQSPDVIAIGDIDDPETAVAACHAAVSGALVLATIAGATVLEALEWLIDSHGGGSPALRERVAWSLRAVVVQHLLRRSLGSGWVPAAEILVNNPTTSRAILNDDEPGIVEAMRRHRAVGMQPLDDALFELAAGGVVPAAEAAAVAKEKDRFAALV